MDRQICSIFQPFNCLISLLTQSFGKIIITQDERLFYLRMVPSGHRRDVAHETTALIREAIARVPLPKLEKIPDEDEMTSRVMEFVSHLIVLFASVVITMINAKSRADGFF